MIVLHFFCIYKSLKTQHRPAVGNNREIQTKKIKIKGVKSYKTIPVFVYKLTYGKVYYTIFIYSFLLANTHHQHNI